MIFMTAYFYNAASIVI